MEFWQVTFQRAQQTLKVWQRLLPVLHIGTLRLQDLRQMMRELVKLAQARAAARAEHETAFRAQQAALRDLKTLAKNLAKLLRGHLDDGTPLMQALRVACRTIPRTEATILHRVRMLLPLWERVNVEVQLVKATLQGRSLDPEAVRGLLAAYARAVQTTQDRLTALQECRAALRAQNRAVDRLNKRWFKVAKATADPGSALETALRGITTAP